MDYSMLIGAWVAAGLTLAMYSFLYDDNPFFKIAEHIYLGVSVGYLIVLTWFQYIMPKLVMPIVEHQQYILLIPALLGLLILTRLIPPIAWMSRLSFAAIVGYTSGLYVPTAIRQFLLPQVGNTIQPLWSLSIWETNAAAGAADPFFFAAAFGMFNKLLVLIGVVAVLVHFFYSVEHKGAVGGVARVGVMYLMFGFGAMFGYTTMGRMSLLFGVTDDLVRYSYPQYGYATPILLVMIIAGIVTWERLVRRREQASE